MILKNPYLVAAALLAGVMLPVSPAFANKTVDSPYVEKGVGYAEWAGGYDVDEDDDIDGHWVQDANFGYGITDFWNFEIGGSFDHDGADDGNTRFDTLTIDNRFELTQPGEYWVDFGVSVAYGKINGDGPDGLEGKLLFAKSIGKFSNLANIVIGREVGEDSNDDMTYGFAWGTAYELNDNLALGLEWYSDFADFDGDFDEQEHQLGPVLYGSFGDNLGFEFGVLGGVSEAAPDAQLKAIINYSYQF